LITQVVVNPTTMRSRPQRPLSKHKSFHKTLDGYRYTLVVNTL